MKYDFTSVLDRSGKDALAMERIPIPGAALKEGFDRIPMWVADMNFPTCPAVTEAIIRRANHPAYGYFLPSEEYVQAILSWQAKQNGLTDLAAEHIGYENSVLGGVVSALRVLCSPGEKVLMHSPTYVGFIGAMKNNGFEPVYSPMKKDDAGIWRMDLADMEQKIRENHIHTAIFCSPHNPCGRVWERQEMLDMMDLFERYGVYVIEDNIWSDLLLGEKPFQSLFTVSEKAKERVIAFSAPTKTFNLAGLVGSYHMVYDDWLRDRLQKEGSLPHYNEMNVLSMHALTGAYSQEGREWMEELREVLRGNVDFACDFIEKHFPDISVSKPEATYMLYLDCGEYVREQQRDFDELLRAGVSVGVIWQDGREFQMDNSIRLNLALPLSRVQEAFRRLKEYVF